VGHWTEFEQGSNVKNACISIMTSVKMVCLDGRSCRCCCCCCDSHCQARLTTTTKITHLQGVGEQQPHDSGVCSLLLNCHQCCQQGAGSTQRLQTHTQPPEDQRGGWCGGVNIKVTGGRFMNLKFVVVLWGLWYVNRIVHHHGLQALIHSLCANTSKCHITHYNTPLRILLLRTC
jgi:hypothetical protein